MPVGTPTVSLQRYWLSVMTSGFVGSKQNDVFGDRADKQCCENLNKSHVQSQAITPAYSLPQVYKQSTGYLMALNLSLDRPNHNNSQSRSFRFLSYEPSVLSSCPRYDLCAAPFSRALMTTWYLFIYLFERREMGHAPSATSAARGTPRIRDPPVLRH